MKSRCFFYFKYSFTLSSKVQISDILKGSSGGSFMRTSSPYSIKVFKINCKKSNKKFLSKILLANFFISIYKDKVPMKFFNNEKDALIWLSQFKTVSLEGDVL